MRLTRATPADLEIRGDGRTVVGIAVPFDQPAEIREHGQRYTEVFRRGAFARTIGERGPERVKFLAQHDRQTLPLGRAVVLREDPTGLYAELRVSKTTHGDDALELIRDGALDALSIGFSPIESGDRWTPDRSMVERTEAKLHEISAVSFPAYAGAAIAGVRSLTNESDDGIRSRLRLTVLHRERRLAMSQEWITHYERQRDALVREAEGLLTRDDLSDDERNRADAIEAELAEVTGKLADARQRQAKLASIVIGPHNTEGEQNVLDRRAAYDAGRDPLGDPRDVLNPRNGNPWREVHERGSVMALSDDDATARARDAVALTSGMSDRQRETATVKLERTEDPNVARFVLATSDPHYVSGWARQMRGDLDLCSPEEREAIRRVRDCQRAMSIVGGSSAGAAMVPSPLDASLVMDADGSISPIRHLARTTLTTSRTHSFVTSESVSASWDVEASEVSDDSPTLGAHTITAHSWRAFVPYSIELELTAGANLTSELSMLLVDAKAQLEAEAFVTGSGSNACYGIVSALTGTSSVVASAATNGLSASDVLDLYEQTPPRYRPRASWIAAAPTYSTIRSFGTNEGYLFTANLTEAAPARILGRPAYEDSNIDSTIDANASNYTLVHGDFGQYAVVDRVGIAIEPVAHIFGASQRPTGQRGLFAYGMTGADSLVDRAFRMLVIN